VWGCVGGCPGLSKDEEGTIGIGEGESRKELAKEPRPTTTQVGWGIEPGMGAGPRTRGRPAGNWDRLRNREHGQSRGKDRDENQG
jgi:hypothetical protein